MAVVTLNSFSTASIAHAPTDDLYIGSSAELVTNSSAIDGPTNGHYDTTIMGKVTSTATIAVYYQNASGVDMSLGAEATVASMGNTAIRLITNSVHLINAGHVSATDNRGIDLQANGSNLNGYFLNTGSVTSVSTAVDVSTAAGRIHIVNDGELTGASGALAIHSSGATAHDLSNSGLISSAYHSLTSIVVTESLNLINSGTVTGIGGALSVGGTLTLTNSGVIDALENAVSAGGLLDMRNTGTVAGGVSALAGDDIVRNHGLIDDVDLGDGSNIVQNLGRIGSVIFGTGKDLYQGRRSQAGADVDGGDGKDTIRGGAHDDSFAGGAGADILRGRSGDDALAGGDGNDLIRGGGGGDEITGGVGRDNLGGGAGADTFIYTSANDGKGKTGDRLHGFDRAEDVIDVSGLGALNFIGHHGFGNNAGELRITTGGGKAVAHIDLTGNGHDDVTIKVLDVGNLSAADFVL